MAVTFMTFIPFPTLFFIGCDLPFRPRMCRWPRCWYTRIISHNVPNISVIYSLWPRTGCVLYSLSLSCPGRPIGYDLQYVLDFYTILRLYRWRWLWYPRFRLYIFHPIPASVSVVTSTLFRSVFVVYWSRPSAHRAFRFSISSWRSRCRCTTTRRCGTASPTSATASNWGDLWRTGKKTSRKLRQCRPRKRIDRSLSKPARAILARMPTALQNFIQIVCWTTSDKLIGLCRCICHHSLLSYVYELCIRSCIL